MVWNEVQWRCAHFRSPHPLPHTLGTRLTPSPVGQDELADQGVEGEAEHTAADGQDQDGGGGVQAVASALQVLAGLAHIDDALLLWGSKGSSAQSVNMPHNGTKHCTSNNIA